VHLVGFTIEMYYDAPSYKHEICTIISYNYMSQQSLCVIFTATCFGTLLLSPDSYNRCLAKVQM